MIFTGIFILYGALKSNNKTGMLSFGIYILCILSFFAISFENVEYSIGETVWANYTETKIHLLNLTLVNILGPMLADQNALHNFGMTIARLVAFAYTYHYLNWFSKTTIIKWHQVSKPKLAITIAIWLISLGIYALNYKVGVVVLLFLSTLHVFFEFPLNYLSVIGVVEELRRIRK